MQQAALDSRRPSSSYYHETPFVTRLLDAGGDMWKDLRNTGGRGSKNVTRAARMNDAESNMSNAGGLLRAIMKIPPTLGDKHCLRETRRSSESDPGAKGTRYPRE